MVRGKKVLVIGAAGLLGANLTKTLLDNGACVLAADLSVSGLKSSLASLGIALNDTNIELHQVDLNDIRSIEAIFTRTDGLTGAVNCSYPRNENYGAKLFDVTLEDFNQNIALSLGSAFLFMQQCAKYFDQKKKPFSLVNVASVYGVIAPKFEIYDNTEMTMPVEYAAIKSSLIHLSKYFVKYVSNSQFRVNLISPGGIEDSQPDQFLRAYKSNSLGKGMLGVEDVTGPILYLLSDYSEFINGQNIVVDDGFSL